MSLFITGTDTGVGKTHTALQLLRLLRAAGTSCAGMKPICCGDRRDAELLLAAGNDGLTFDDVNPVWLKTPAAPIVGSLVEEVNIDIEQILAAFRALQDRVEHVIVGRNRIASLGCGAEPARLSKSYGTHRAKHSPAQPTLRRCHAKPRRCGGDR